jgi:hypothetical protein
LKYQPQFSRRLTKSQLLNRYVLDPCRILPPAVEQPPPGFGIKHHPEKEHNLSSRFEATTPVILPTFTGFPQFTGVGQGMFDAPDWQMGGNGAMRIEERASRGRRGGPGGPMRRGMDGPRDHPYERRAGWNERRPGPGGDGIGRVRETRPLRSYRDLDAPQEATPELNY